MRLPTVHTANALKNHDTTVCVDGKWVPARPLPYSPVIGETFKMFLYRIRVAFRVFTGKYDAVNWEERQQ